MSPATDSHHVRLVRVARRAMLEYGFEPDFPLAALDAAERLVPPAVAPNGEVRDLRALPWCSIDNDDSRDLDQLTVAEPLADGATRVRVAVADVSAVVAPGDALDRHAAANTTHSGTKTRLTCRTYSSGEPSTRCCNGISTAPRCSTASG